MQSTIFVISAISTWSPKSTDDVDAALNGFASRMSGSDEQAMALKQMFQLVHQEGVVMAFADVFLLLCLLYVAFAGMIMLMRKPDPVAAGAEGH